MSLIPTEPVEKYCFVYCGPERCNCQHKLGLSEPFQPTAAIAFPLPHPAHIPYTFAECTCRVCVAAVQSQPKQSTGTAPYSIGSSVWPGLSKVGEEAGETVQVISKIIGAEGRAIHFDGTDLNARLEEELADMQAAIDFVVDHNPSLRKLAIIERRLAKLALFQQWHRENLARHSKSHCKREQGCVCTGEAEIVRNRCHWWSK